MVFGRKIQKEKKIKKKSVLESRNHKKLEKSKEKGVKKPLAPA